MAGETQDPFGTVGNLRNTVHTSPTGGLEGQAPDLAYNQALKDQQDLYGKGLVQAGNQDAYVIDPAKITYDAKYGYVTDPGNLRPDDKSWFQKAGDIFPWVATLGAGAAAIGAAGAAGSGLSGSVAEGATTYPYAGQVVDTVGAGTPIGGTAVASPGAAGMNAAQELAAGGMTPAQAAQITGQTAAASSPSWYSGLENLWNAIPKPLQAAGLAGLTSALQQKPKIERAPIPTDINGTPMDAAYYANMGSQQLQNLGFVSNNPFTVANMKMVTDPRKNYGLRTQAQTHS